MERINFALEPRYLERQKHNVECATKLLNIRLKRFIECSDRDILVKVFNVVPEVINMVFSNNLDCSYYVEESIHDTDITIDGYNHMRTLVIDAFSFICKAYREYLSDIIKYSTENDLVKIIDEVIDNTNQEDIPTEVHVYISKVYAAIIGDYVGMRATFNEDELNKFKSTIEEISEIADGHGEDVFGYLIDNLDDIINQNYDVVDFDDIIIADLDKCLAQSFSMATFNKDHGVSYGSLKFMRYCLKKYVLARVCGYDIDESREYLKTTNDMLNGVASMSYIVPINEYHG